uniref:Uncharacterized protein n=1 Tax=uncultured prokaryote TaxID=198431 RepID=A0A0H5Q7K2_9ZZZZ|nr:hypothetical protein [uncultured prokaryote]
MAGPRVENRKWAEAARNERRKAQRIRAQQEVLDIYAAAETLRDFDGAKSLARIADAFRDGEELVRWAKTRADAERALEAAFGTNPILNMAMSNGFARAMAYVDALDQPGWSGLDQP